MLARREMRGLDRRWLSLCETPDLDLVPQRFAPREAALFRAGLELSILHLGLSFLSLAVRGGMARSLVPLAPLLRWGADLARGLGTDRGGMLVEAVGIDGDGERLRATWSLVAAAGDGPVIPTLPALAVVRALDAGKKFEPGARACVGIFDLATIEREFAPYHIDTAITRARPAR
jgi:hypothetical protein